jgi:hypothetical protein
MHKSDVYGTIELKQKYKQTIKQNDNQTYKQIYFFASQIARQMPYSLDEVYEGLCELIDEKVVVVEGDLLIQRRMLRDGKKSISRSISGQKGGLKPKKNTEINTKAKVEAKSKQNTENEIEYNTIDKVDKIDTNTTYSSAPKKQKAKAFVKPTLEEVIAFQKEVSGKTDPAQFLDHYEANGWKVGNASMKNWKATYRNWERRSGNFQKIDSVPQKTNTGKGVEPTNVYGDLELKMLADIEESMADLPPVPEYYRATNHD